ncbi:MAG: hypothetical protein A2496_22825 [Burkholderiales bacterium RIFOXYC12_FULL_60_6]|nr:MAG: hypothetical protein A2496_22825 [Burkholderiales bacterium RIFOXYC12_FULL_60_6]
MQNLTTESSRPDARPDLLRAIAPYYMGTSIAVVVLGVVGGWAVDVQFLVLGILLLQMVGSVILGFLTQRWKRVAALGFTQGLWNMTAMTAIVLITGGFTSPFWVLFIIGAAVSGVLIDRPAIYVNLALTGGALVIPWLPAGIDMAAAMGVGLQMVIVLFVGLVTEKAARHASDEQGKYQAAAEALRQSNDRLALSIEHTERQTREVHVMAEMGRMLQTSAARDELINVIASYARELFPTETGALFIYSPSRDDLEAVVTWGDFPADGSQRRFAPDECWSLRLGQKYQQDAAHVGLHCPHVNNLQSNHYLCVPVMAHGETLGVLHLRFSMDESGAGATTSPRTIEALSALAGSIAEYVALAFANQLLRDRLRNQAIRDPLTDLFNRRYAEETLVRELQLAVRKQTPLSVIFLDLDHFKRINDTYGHDAGDVVLEKVGILMKTHTRGHDVACRYGGEEFLLVMSDTPLEVARQRAEALREGIRSLDIVYKTQSIAVTASFGVAAFPDSGADRDQLLKAVDVALYEAKTSGRNRVVTANPVAGGSA